MAQVINGWLHCRVWIVFRPDEDNKKFNEWHPYSVKLDKIYAFKKFKTSDDELVKNDEVFLSGNVSIIWLTGEGDCTATIDISPKQLREHLGC